MKTPLFFKYLLPLCLVAGGYILPGQVFSAPEEKTPPIWEMKEDTTLKRNQALPDFKKIQSLAKDKKGITWVITGDSITHGALHTHSMRSYPEHWAEMMRWENRRFDDVIINTGISGDRVGGIVSKFDNRVKRFAPQVVSVNIGMNDCGAGEQGLSSFKQGLTEAVKKIRALNAIPVLQVPSITNNDESDRGKKLTEYSKVVREVADKEKVLLVDHEAHWKKFARTPEIRKSWMNDGIHPNGRGHQEMYKKMAYDLGLMEPGKATSKMGDKTL